MGDVVSVFVPDATNVFKNCGNSPRNHRRVDVGRDFQRSPPSLLLQGHVEPFAVF